MKKLRDMIAGRIPVHIPAIRGMLKHIEHLMASERRKGMQAALELCEDAALEADTDEERLGAYECVRRVNLRLISDIDAGREALGEAA